MGGEPRGEKHEDRIDQQDDRQTLEDCERTGDRRIGLEILKDEALDRIPADREIETIVDRETITLENGDEIDDEEQRHCGAFVKRRGVAHDPVAEIVAPRQMRRRSISKIVDPCIKTADAPN